MYGTTDPLPDFVLNILTGYLQLRLFQDLHGTPDHGWIRRRQEEGTVGPLRGDIPSPRSLTCQSSGSVERFQKCAFSVNIARSVVQVMDFPTCLSINLYFNDICIPSPRRLIQSHQINSAKLAISKRN